MSRRPTITFTDRYGGHPPDPATMCLGPCEGMGWVPVRLRPDRPDFDAYWERQSGFAGMGAELTRRWHAAPPPPSDDPEWRFVRCPCCEGSGKRAACSPAAAT